MSQRKLESIDCYDLENFSHVIEIINTYVIMEVIVLFNVLDGSNMFKDGRIVVNKDGVLEIIEEE